MTLPEATGSLTDLDLVRAALAEDVGDGDRTTLWTVVEAAEGKARIIAKQDGILAGVAVADRVFTEIDPALRTSWQREDGQAVETGEEVLRVEGCLRSILTAERTALNFLGRLSGIATLAGRYAAAVRGTEARVTDTRKTTPGWRRLEKAAVAAGGCANHRQGLYDMVLIKENHIRAAGGVGAALRAVQGRAAAEGLEIEIEVRDLSELEQALPLRPGRILLDNMSVPALGEAVRLVREAEGRRILLEASGGVSLDGVREIAETGVDLISVGALTHSAPVLDLSLQVEGRDGAGAPERGQKQVEHGEGSA